jgi:branched-chain amino acid transport system substrate-binding protein
MANLKMALNAACCAALLLFAAPARADITIGVALPQTGPVASIGDQVLNGAKAAAADINAAGGINGQPLVLDVQDDACDPRQAVSVANLFTQRGVGLIAGHVCSGASLAASNVYAENGDVMVTPASNTAKLTDRGLAGIFRVCGRDDDQGKLDAEVIAQRFPKAKIALLHDNTAFSRGLADATRAGLLEKGINVTIFDAVTAGDFDFSAIIARLKSEGIQLAYYGGYHKEMGALVRQSAEQGFRGQWMGTSGIATSEFAHIAGPASEGVLMTFNPDARLNPSAAKVVAGFREKGIEPEGFTMYGYAAVQVIALAAQSAHSAKPADVEAALKHDKFSSVLGDVSFNAKGDISSPGYVLYVWKDGKFIYAP